MAAELRLRLEGLPALMEQVSGLNERVAKAQKLAMSDSIMTVLRKVSFNLTGAVLHVQLGRLRQSLQTSVASDGSTGTIGTNAEYAAIHEFGGRTMAHEIRPRGMALRFLSPGFIGPVKMTSKGKISKSARSGVTFARVVHHPGSTVPARPYMRPALEDSREAIKGFFVGRLAEALRSRA